jgi:hypothetical protein
MTNVATKATIDSLIPYLPDGVEPLVRAFWRALPRDTQFADNLLLYAYHGITTTKQEIDDDAGARPLLVIAKSTGTKCYIHFWNADADSVTEGVNVDWLVPVSATSGEVTVCLMAGAGWKTFWDTGLTVAASTATETSAAPTNTPDIWVIYAGS